MSKTRILATGVTGYIGGSVLNELLNYHNLSKVEVTAVVRSPDKAEKLKELGINVVIGSHTDQKLMEKLAEETDLVLAMADADSLEAVGALLSGFKKRFEKKGTPAFFIETSGTGVLVDDAVGDFKSDTIYDDANPDQIETLAPTQPHRNVDLELLKADSEGYIRAYFVLPSTIWGIAEGVLVERGIQNPHSQQVPMLVRASLGRGRAGMVGKGLNVWPNVHIKEVAELYMLLVDRVLQDPDEVPHGREGFYFGENGEHTFYELSRAIGEGLVAIGKSSDAEPSTFSKEEIDKYLHGYIMAFGTNSRARSNRSRALGWKPTKGKADFLASIKPEIEVWSKKAAL